MSFKVITWNTAKLSSDYIISTTTFVSLAIVRYLIKDKKWLLLIQLSFSIDCWKIFAVQLQRTRHLTCRKLVTVTALLWLQGEFPSYFVGLIIKEKDRESSANYRKLAVSFILLTIYRWSTWKVKRRSCKCDIGADYLWSVVSVLWSELCNANLLLESAEAKKRKYLFIWRRMPEDAAVIS